MDAVAPKAPTCTLAWRNEDEAMVVVGGPWAIAHARAAETASEAIAFPTESIITFDLSAITAIDTAGAWLIHRMRARLEFQGRQAVLIGKGERAAFLFEEIEEHVPRPYEPPRRGMLVLVWLEETGRWATEIVRDAAGVLSILGAFAIGLFNVLIRPHRLRGISILSNFDRACRQAVPIVALMSVLIGLIVAQQGGFYLRQFGAGVFVVDLIGVLVLRELGVLLTAIMIAGRSGSAFTAEIGAMKMQEEIDALRVIGLEPLEVLVLPKMMALILALPVLTFIADISALLGAILISWTYLGITPVNFIARLHEAVSPHELYIGLIKAPFFAIIIGLIACMEGLKVGGSAESLGLRTTNSVVKAIFMVIVVDGVFAIFFASIGV
jgi:phospholipid/cholesterol/gamma-HCH transport system permease protein